MTLSEKAEIALGEIRKTRPECKSIKHAGKWRGRDIFEDSTDYPDEVPVIGGPTGVVSVSSDGEPMPIFISDITSRDFPELS